MGNYFFWLTFCIFGQPACILLYYYDFVEKSKVQSFISEASLAAAAGAAMSGNQTATIMDNNMAFDVLEREHTEL